MSSVFLKKKVTSSGETHLSLAGGKFKIKPTELNELYEHLVEDFKNKKQYYFKVLFFFSIIYAYNEIYK